MFRASFLLVTAIILSITAAPVFVFAYLKYHGLEDPTGAGSEYEEVEATAICYVWLKYDQFEHKITTQGDPCGVMICEDGGCGVKFVQGSSEVVDAQSDQLREQAVAEFDRLNKPTNAEEPEDTSPQEQNESEAIAEEEESVYKYPLWQWLSIFSVAITFSVFGVSTSVISRKDTRYPVSIFRSVRAVLAIYFLACVSGVLLVSLFAGGFLQGNLFPNFSGDLFNYGFNSWVALKFRGQDWFKLAVWAYISGFYERFLPDILDSVIKKANEPKPDGTEAEPA